MEVGKGGVELDEGVIRKRSFSRLYKKKWRELLKLLLESFSFSD